MFKKGIIISLWGTGIEAVGIFLDIMHHLNIGLETPEGLITPNHLIIFIGFLINFTGVILTMISGRKIYSKLPLSGSAPGGANSIKGGFG